MIIAITMSRSLLIQMYIFRVFAECKDDQFNCGPFCIPEDQKCDGNRDCDDGLDEADCGEYLHGGGRRSKGIVLSYQYPLAPNIVISSTPF